MSRDTGTVTLVSSQTGTTDVEPSVGNQLIPCLRPAVLVSLRATNEGARIVKPFQVLLYISTDDTPDTKTDFRLEGIGWFILSLDTWDTVSTLQALQPAEKCRFFGCILGCQIYRSMERVGRFTFGPTSSWVKQKKHSISPADGLPFTKILPISLVALKKFLLLPCRVKQ